MDPIEPTRITETLARQRARMFTTSWLGSYLGVGQPTFDEENRQWRVPIHSPLLGSADMVGEIVLSAEGQVVQSTPREEITAELERRQAAARPYASIAPSGEEPPPVDSDGLLALNELLRDYAHEFTKIAPALQETEFALRSESTLHSPAPPVDWEALSVALKADPALDTALRYLLTVLRNPDQRDTLLNVLASFAHSEEETSR